MRFWIWVGCCGDLLLNLWWWLAPRSDSLMGRLVPESVIWGTFSWFVIYSFPSWEITSICYRSGPLQVQKSSFEIYTVLQIFDFLSRGKFLHRKLTKIGEFVTKNVVTCLFQVLIPLASFENNPIFLVRVCLFVREHTKMDDQTKFCRQCL